MYYCVVFSVVMEDAVAVARIRAPIIIQLDQKKKKIWTFHTISHIKLNTFTFGTIESRHLKTSPWKKKLDGLVFPIL